MLKPLIKKTVSFNGFRQEASRVKYWRVMDNAALKTLFYLFLIIRNCSDINIKLKRNNLNLQSLYSVLNLTQQFTSARQGLYSNKSINADCQTVVVCLKARCAAGYFKR